VGIEVRDILGAKGEERSDGERKDEQEVISCVEGRCVAVTILQPPACPHLFLQSSQHPPLNFPALLQKFNDVVDV